MIDDQSVIMRFAFPAVLSLLLLGCPPPADPGPSIPRISRLGLRSDVTGCYAVTHRPPLGVPPRDDWAVLNTLELATSHVYPYSSHRRMHLPTTALSQAYPGLKPVTLHRLPAYWSADSLTDSISLWVSIDRTTISARVVRTNDGGLSGVSARASEGVVLTSQDAAKLHVSLGSIAWRAVPCRSLSLNRAVALD